MKIWISSKNSISIMFIQICRVITFRSYLQVRSNKEKKKKKVGGTIQELLDTVKLEETLQTKGIDYCF